MADQFYPEVQPALPEHDLAAVAAEVEKHLEHPETRELTGPELVKKSLQMISATAPPAPAPEEDDAQLPTYVVSAPAATKLDVEHLLTLAFRDGIIKASAEAAKSNPFVLDAFHDALAGKLYPELKKRGIVE